MAISQDIRHFIAYRADNRCEYCLIHEDYTFKPHEVDHIISRKHSGPDEDINCNRSAPLRQAQGAERLLVMR